MSRRTTSASPQARQPSPERIQTEEEYHIMSHCNQTLERYILNNKRRLADEHSMSVLSGYIPLPEHEQKVDAVKNRLQTEIETIRSQKNDLAIKNSELTRQLDRATQKLNESKRDQAEMEKDRGNLQQEIVQLTRNIHDKDGELADLKARLDAARKEDDRKQVKIDSLESQLNDMTNRFNDASSDAHKLIVELNATQEDSNITIRDLQNEVARLMKELEEATVDTDLLVKDIRSEFAKQARQEIDLIRQKLLEERDELLRLQMEGFNKQLAELREENTKLETDLTEAYRLRDQLQVEASRAQDQRDDFEAKCRDLERRLRKAQDQLQNLPVSGQEGIDADEKARLIGRIQELQDEVNHLRQFSLPIDQACDNLEGMMNVEEDRLDYVSEKPGQDESEEEQEDFFPTKQSSSSSKKSSPKRRTSPRKKGKHEDGSPARKRARR